jgi:cell division septum initiation protein DivIVA
MLVFHMPPQKLTPDIIQAAIEGFEAQKRRIDAQISELRQTLDGGRPEVAAPSTPPKRKRRMSAAGRKAIAEAARKRWAAIRANSAESQPPSSKKAPRKRSLAK